MPSKPMNVKLPPPPDAEEWVADASRAYDAIARVPLPVDEECWRQMPVAAAGGGGPLPNWARALAAHMPRTAAAMLVLDHAQRTKAPLDPVLRAKIRWVVALANRSIYSMAYAAADLGAAGATEADLASLADPEHVGDTDCEALVFARQLAEEPAAISDGQFASLVEQYGQRSVAAMVHVAAYGCFQDRLISALNLPLEKAGPLAPLPVRFVDSAFAPAPIQQPQRQPPGIAGGEAAVHVDAVWRRWDYQDLQAWLAMRRRCRPRLAIPGWEAIKTSLPPEYPQEQPVYIRWALVAMGYVPELALPWNTAARMFWVESQQEPVYEASLLWIQSRAMESSYAMGHAEMLLDLARIEGETAGERARALARGDWSDFPIEEQLAFAFACLLTSAHWKVSDSDLECLQQELGARRALHTIWWLCRGLYLSRIADAFQLPLESDNVLLPRTACPQRPAAELAVGRTRAWKTA